MSDSYLVWRGWTNWCSEVSLFDEMSEFHHVTFKKYAKKQWTDTFKQAIPDYS